MVNFGLNKEIGNVYPEMCRRCINDIHNTHLKPEHCLYDHYRYNCPRCGAYSHIVKKVTFAGHVRMFLHKRKTKRIEKNLSGK